MTVKDLINLLKTYNQDKIIYVGYWASDGCFGYQLKTDAEEPCIQEGCFYSDDGEIIEEFLIIN